jgi:hypothetical protein
MTSPTFSLWPSEGDDFRHSIRLLENLQQACWTSYLLTGSFTRSICNQSSLHQHFDEVNFCQNRATDVCKKKGKEAPGSSRCVLYLDQLNKDAKGEAVVEGALRRGRVQIKNGFFSILIFFLVSILGTI